MPDDDKRRTATIAAALASPFIAALGTYTFTESRKTAQSASGAAVGGALVLLGAALAGLSGEQLGASTPPKRANPTKSVDTEGTEVLETLNQLSEIVTTEPLDEPQVPKRSRAQRKLKSVNPSEPSVEDAARASTEFHWGESPKHEDTIELPDYSAIYSLGRIHEVTYETSKAGESALWVHKFDKPRPHITATPSGKLGPIIGGDAHVTERGIEG